ncbi:hypothetical protein U0C82_01595 [Fulvimarina sp. 2208YS6-2-32]|uniref:PH domain-containing protein n=1 Tax=Fulvimarina uroteuthidis TaxID=3098149 RepID=A0ABU5I0Z0_9HYPH|nr:hypothetical protein [Fulvimarina sp. 2208YS6-2-32]MDY8107841.1 hypothetical protein [Fulvimarina sp. 2208YS6-2-32]
MNETNRDMISIPAKQGRLSLAGVAILVISVWLAVLCYSSLDPDWVSGSNRFAWVDDLPPIVRASIFLSVAAYLLLYGFHFLRLGNSGTIAIFTNKEARVKSITGWREIGWENISRIEIKGGLNPIIILRRRRASGVERVWPSFDPCIPINQVALSKDALLAELSGRRPDLLDPAIHQKPDSIVPNALQHVPIAPARTVEVNSKSWTG